MSCQDVDFSTMKHLTMPSKQGTEMAVSVTKNREICLNGKFLQEIKKINPDGMVCVDYTEDGRAIMIRDAGKANDFRFGKNGRVKHKEFAGELEKLGYGIPARYVVKWNSEKEAWIGILQEVQNAPIPRNISPNRKRTRKKVE